MTEAEWRACTDPAPMLHWLDPGYSERRWRLFACACCRHLWHLLSEAERAILEAVERCADGLLPAEELYATAGVHRIAGVPNYVPGHIQHGYRAVLEAASPHAWFRARNARAFVVDALRAAAGPAERVLEWRRPSDLLRCLFGNPFHPVTLDLSWYPPKVVQLAQAIYDERAFDRLPLLADALEEAGCTNAAILAHCRDSGEHVRGCWVLDLLLGKE